MVISSLRASADATLNLPPFGWSALFSEWGVAPVPFVVTIWAAGLYLWGVRTLHKRGDSWPVGRTIAFVGAGLGSFYLATCSGWAAYDSVLLSVHMGQHMVLSMLVPSDARAIQ